MMNGQRLRAARRQAGLTQGALGQRAGLSQSMIGAMERGERTASLAALDSLATALNIPVADLLDGQSAGTSPERLLEDARTPAGLRALAADRVLAAALNIQPREWRALRSIEWPGHVNKDGYLALLLTLRMICQGEQTDGPAGESP